MRRFIIDKIVQWKNNPKHKPLILRGARQVGKTWAVKKFGEQHFAGRFHIIDFEKRSDLHSIFDKNLDVTRILSELELALNRSIEPGADLLFFDEIQSCPRALMALRYFYEETPSLHIIAAGSLLDFALAKISFPVGRVRFLNMYPMNFSEFLLAVGRDKLAEVLLSAESGVSETAHQMLLDELRNYFFVGGMPECVKTYAETKRLIKVSEIQRDLIETFRADFSKYAAYADKRCLNSVLTNTARKVGRQIKYAQLADGFTPPTNKKAFDLLNSARLIYKIRATSPAGLPLGAEASDKKFKALMLDIGLMQHLCALNVSEVTSKASLLNIYNGALAEQFVGQELLACGVENLYYWARNAKSSSAEVDYLIEHNGKIAPIEVKSGAAGKLRSLHLLLKTYPGVENGFILSEREFAQIPEQRLVFYPLYHTCNFGS